MSKLALLFCLSDTGADSCAIGPLDSVDFIAGGGISITAHAGEFHANIIPGDDGTWSVDGQDQHYRAVNIVHYADVREIDDIRSPDGWIDEFGPGSFDIQ